MQSVSIEQLSRFIDFDNDKAIIANNADWLLDLNYVEFLREIGVHFSVQQNADCQSATNREWKED